MLSIMSRIFYELCTYDIFSYDLFRSVIRINFSILPINITALSL